MANTIKTKRSTTTATPPSLAEGEQGYSELSGNLYIGTSGSNLEKIGGNADVLKLAGIEAGATGDQTATEIETLYEGLSNTNKYTDTEKTKLAGLESSKYLGTYTSLSALETAHPSPAVGSYAHVDGGVGVEVVMYIWDDDDDEYVALAGVSGTETPASIKTKYESNADTNAFTDADETKLDGIDAGANNYTHPANHQPSIITQDSSNRFVTDTQITTWNDKLGPNDTIDGGTF